jgi:hypothetical protein
MTTQMTTPDDNTTHQMTTPDENLDENPDEIPNDNTRWQHHTIIKRQHHMTTLHDNPNDNQDDSPDDNLNDNTRWPTGWQP